MKVILDLVLDLDKGILTRRTATKFGKTTGKLKKAKSEIHNSITARQILNI
jgi:hypothetical protein